METLLQTIIENVNLLHQKIKTLSNDKKWDKDFIERVKIDFTYNSNKLEGNTLTYGETINFLKSITIPHKRHKDILDIDNHHNLLDKVFQQLDEPISIEFIKEIHKELMKDVDQWDYESLPNPGQFKLFENYTILPSGKIKEFMKPSDVEGAVNELIKTTNTLLSEANLKDIKKHPLTIATAFHNRLLNEIHPFQDGNGRIVRIFTNMILLKCDFPPIFIETGDDIEREKYLNTIHESEQKDNLDPMIIYNGAKLIESLERKYSFIQQASMDENIPKIPETSNLRGNKKSNGLSI